MKSKVFLLLVLAMIMPLIAEAQITGVTESQKQMALQTASKFCSLMVQWSNGQRTLDRNIYSLCSGNDCSAYDDVTTKKETTIRNYLLGIQKKYPRTLNLSITQPTLSNCEIIYEPVIAAYQHLSSIGQNSADPYSMTDIFELQNVSNKNAYFVFKIMQKIPTLGINTERLLVYDLAAGKITAYVTGDGTFTSYLAGLNLMTQKDYKNAIQKFDVAANNPRASLKKRCYILASACCGLINDIPGVIHYGRASKDPVYSCHADMMDFYLNEKYSDAYRKCKEIERLVLQDKDFYGGMLSGIYSCMALLCSMENEQVYNPQEAVDYFRKAIRLGRVQSGYLLQEIWFRDDNFEDVISTEEVMGALKWAAEQGHPAAIFKQGLFSDATEGIDAGIKWFEKGALLGDAFCMAHLGKRLISKGGTNVAIGKKWLRKALEGDMFEKQMEGYRGLINENFWPSSRNDIQTLLDNTGGTIGNTSTSSYNNTPSISTSTPNSYISHSSVTTSNNSLYPSSKPRKYRSRPFNSPYDDHNVAGWSVGYVQKYWNMRNGENKEKWGYWDDSKCLHGLQTGIRIEPLFKYGFGLNTGIYYEFYQSKSEEQNYEGVDFRGILQEHALYVPMHLEYRIHISRKFQLFFYGGIGLDYGIKAKLKTDNEDLSYDEDDAYEGAYWKRFNVSYEFGGGLCIKHIQLNFTTSRGLLNMGDDDYDVKQNKNFMCSLSFMF